MPFQTAEVCHPYWNQKLATWCPCIVSSRPPKLLDFFLLHATNRGGNSATDTKTNYIRLKEMSRRNNTNSLFRKRRKTKNEIRRISLIDWNIDICYEKRFSTNYPILCQSVSTTKRLPTYHKDIYLRACDTTRTDMES